MSNVKFFLPSSADLISRSGFFLKWEKNWDFWSYDEISKTMAKDHAILVFAEQDDQLAGLAFWSFTAEDAELLYVFVSEEFRGQKLGYQLLNHSFKYLGDKGIKNLFLEVRPSNRKALFLYKKLGFMEINRRRSYYANGEDCIVMRKDFD